MNMQSTSAALVVLEDGQVQTYLLKEKPIWNIGRISSARPQKPDICFWSLLVSREHGWLQEIEGQWFYIDNPRNKNGTFFNGCKLSRPLSGMKQPVPLEHGDILRIEGSQPSSQDILMLFLDPVIEGTLQTFVLNDRDIRIGSASPCELVVHGQGLEAVHGKLTRINGVYYLSGSEDVLLNGRPLLNTTQLRQRDCIRMGDCFLLFLEDKLLYTYQGT